MIHIETLIKFKESLPDADTYRSRVLKLHRKEPTAPVQWEGDYKEWDTDSTYRSPDYPKKTPIVFRSDYVQDKWQWVFLGEVVL
jgi:hypothetical protein